MKTTTVLVMMCTIVVFTTTSVIAATNESLMATGQRPTSNGEPTEITASLVLIDLTNINGATQSFTADLFMLLSWHDPRLAVPESGERRLPLDQIWNPMIQILNQQKVARSFPEQVDVAADGTVSYRQRFYGEFSAPMDLHDFPIDHHQIGFRLVVPRYSSEEIHLVPASGGLGAVTSLRLSIVDWVITDFEARAEDFSVSKGAPPIAGLTAQFRAQRKLGFYLSKAFLSVAIIVFMSWIVFWVDSSYVAPRMSIAVTSMLTLIAYRFLLGGILPPLSYLTRMDHFLLVSTMLVLLVIIQVALTTHRHTVQQPDRALALNRTSRWVFPLTFAILSMAVLLAA